MNILDTAKTKSLTCSHDTGKCLWHLVADGERETGSCDSEKAIYNAAIDAKIAELQSLDVPSQIAILEAKKR